MSLARTTSSSSSPFLRRRARPDHAHPPDRSSPFSTAPPPPPATQQSSSSSLLLLSSSSSFTTSNLPPSSWSDPPPRAAAAPPPPPPPPQEKEIGNDPSRLVSEGPTTDRHASSSSSLEGRVQELEMQVAVLRQLLQQQQQQQQSLGLRLLSSPSAVVDPPRSEALTTTADMATTTTWGSLALPTTSNSSNNSSSNSNSNSRRIPLVRDEEEDRYMPNMAAPYLESPAPSRALLMPWDCPPDQEEDRRDHDLDHHPLRDDNNNNNNNNTQKKDPREDSRAENTTCLKQSPPKLQRRPSPLRPERMIPSFSTLPPSPNEYYPKDDDDDDDPKDKPPRENQDVATTTTTTTASWNNSRNPSPTDFSLASKSGAGASLPPVHMEEEDPSLVLSTPIRPKKRNLSFRLLYGGFDDPAASSPPESPTTQSAVTTPRATEITRVTDPGKDATAPPSTSEGLRPRRTAQNHSLTAWERAWMGPRIRQLLQQQQTEEEAPARSSSPPRRPFPDDKVKNKWLNYLNSVQESTPDVDVQMEEFIKVPAGVEGTMNFGFFICVDSFLYMITVLPIRFVWSCLLFVMSVVLSKSQAFRQWSNFQFHRRHLYPVIQVFILWSIHRHVLGAISVGKLYHFIRGQSMIKLYVLIAIVEVFDRLFSSLGQDCLDSMYWNTVNRPRSSRMVISVVVVLAYCAVHALLLLVHVATLNVAMNSADQALLTLLISGNFSEIKSTVFKKHNKAGLFKVTAADICERFKLALFLGLVLLLNLCQGMDQGQYVDYMRICSIVWCTEMLADWIKHAFVTKFNFLPARVYTEFNLLLAGDVTGIGHEGVNLDHSHAVVKRIGFAQIPLVCVMFRLVREALKYASMTRPVMLLSPVGRRAVGLCLWLLLLLVKLVLGNLLQRSSMTKLHAAPEYSSQQQTPFSQSKKKKHAD